MKDAVLIKSFTNGITLLMREDASLEEILQELAVKFTEAKNFFGTSSMDNAMVDVPKKFYHGIVHGGT